MKKINYLLFMFCLVGAQHSLGQSFTYKRALLEINSGWRTIRLPDDIYTHINSDFSDIRIIGVTTNGDTIKVPFLLKERADKTTSIKNEVEIDAHYHKGNYYYYVFKSLEKKPVNAVTLEVNQSEFNWLISFEGSNDKATWTTIATQHRVVGVSNHGFAYKHAKLTFPEVNYTFYRVKIPSFISPRLHGISLFYNNTIPGKRNQPIIANERVQQNTIKNETQITVQLEVPLPIASIHIPVLDSTDYYRPMDIKYAIDSFKRDSIWYYKYRNLYRGTLSSFEKSDFEFNNTILKYVKITVKNYDNQPLKIGHVQLSGYEYELQARFTETATYYLVYGNPKATFPNFDIDKFKTGITANPTTIVVGPEERIIPISESEDEGSINKYWLWAIMLSSIFILGWFSLKLLKND